MNATIIVVGVLALGVVAGIGAHEHSISVRATEHYTTNMLSENLTEHTRVVRNGRYVTICYWVTSAFNGEGTSTDLSTCHTEREYFNGY